MLAILAAFFLGLGLSITWEGKRINGLVALVGLAVCAIVWIWS